MSIDAIVDGLVRFGEDDWIGLWLIVADVADALGVEDSPASLEATLGVVRELLRRGFLAGESPVRSDGIHFAAWPAQDPEVVVDLIRRQWTRNPAYPSWEDTPWFAARRFCRFNA